MREEETMANTEASARSSDFIKNLGRMYRDVEGISGATILGDGTVALIIDVPRLVETATAADS